MTSRRVWRCGVEEVARAGALLLGDHWPEQRRYGETGIAASTEQSGEARRQSDEGGGVAASAAARPRLGRKRSAEFGSATARQGGVTRHRQRHRGSGAVIEERWRLLLGSRGRAMGSLAWRIGGEPASEAAR
jgi:hypothetical protein